MITPMTMHDAICNFLEAEVANRYKLKSVDTSGNEIMKYPQVVRSGYILPSSIDEDEGEVEEFPFILPRIYRQENIKGERTRTVTLDIMFGVYAPGLYDEETGRRIDDGSGYRDLWNLIEATTQVLFANMIIDSKYSLVDDFYEAEMIPEQIYPYWEGYCRTKWHVAYPQPNPSKLFFGKEHGFE